MTSVDDEQFFACARYGNVHKPALFLNVACGDCALRRENSVFECDEEYVVEFKSFHRVYRGNRDVIFRVHLVGVGYERDGLHKIGDACAVVVLLELLNCRYEFFDVFESVGVLGFLTLRKSALESASTNDVLHELHCFHLL